MPIKPSPAPSVQATFIRGGTSKALFFHEKDLPPAGPIRDKFLIRVMGSPDPSQIDGMGGSKIVTSKAAIIRPSQRPDADVDYSFVQVSLAEAEVSYDANCGNISSGVAPFAINEGLVESETWYEGKRVVRIFNTGMKAILVAHCPVDPLTGRALEKGDYAISGVPGTGAPILMDYSQTAKAEAILPTGNVIDSFDCTFGAVDVTYCEVGNPIAFVAAESLGIQGSETVPALDNNKDFIGRVREVRGRIAAKLGRCEDWSKVDEQSPMLPMVALVSKPTSEEGMLQSRLFLDNHCHPSMAGTGGVCTTATSRIEGSVVNRLLSPATLNSESFIIQHPIGHLPMSVKTHSACEENNRFPTFDVLGFMRTARYLFQGSLFVPADIEESFEPQPIVNDSHAAVKSHAADGASANGPVNQLHTDSGNEEGVEVTKRLAAFTHEARFENLSSSAVERLRQCLLDFIGVAELGEKVAESSPFFLKGIQAVTAGSQKTNLVLGTAEKFPPQYAAMLNSAFGHSPDFDDTHTEGIIHISVNIVPVVLAEVESQPHLTYQDILAAMGVGFEIAARIAIALGASSWHRGFHNTSVAGIFGAVAVLARLRGLNLKQTENAFGLAGSFASGSMQYLANGAWNKRIHPGKAVHDAFIVAALAEAGVLGATQPIEGKFGLIAAHTDTPGATVNLDGLGDVWQFVNTGLKPYPACRAIHTSIELASLLAPQGQTRPVKSIRILMDPVPFPVVGTPLPNKVHPDNVVDAQFSAYYQTAASWIYGDDEGWAIYDHLHDPAVKELCGKITVEAKKMSHNLVTTMIATWEDGETKELTLERPKWQEPERPPQRAEVVRKFKSLAVPYLGEENANKVAEFVSGPLDAPVSHLLAALQ